MSPRFYAMLHIAMFDAVNAIEREYSPYVGRIRRSHGASAEAAAAQAAHDILVSLIPASQARFDAKLAGPARRHSARTAQRQGVAIGHDAAARVLDWRANDGWQVTPPAYEPPAIPGLWQRTPPFGPAGFTHFPGVVPFALPTATFYLPPSFPHLDTAKYAEDFNEVKSIGSDTSTVRSDRADAALTPLCRRRNSDDSIRDVEQRDARCGAGGPACPSSIQRVYSCSSTCPSTTRCRRATRASSSISLWRPVTAIRRADEDMNLATEAATLDGPR